VSGSVAASTAVGKTTGVAPEADLYYIALTPNYGKEGEVADADFELDCPRHRTDSGGEPGLPDPAKIRVIGVSAGWNPKQTGHDEFQRAVAKAKTARVLVLVPELRTFLVWHGAGWAGIFSPIRTSRPLMVRTVGGKRILRRPANDPRPASFCWCRRTPGPRPVPPVLTITFFTP